MFTRRLLTIICLVSAAVSCTKEPGGRSPQHKDSLESNIIYNGNVTLFAFNRWEKDDAENSNKRREIIRHIGQLGGIGSREAMWNSYGSVEPVSFGGAYDFSVNDKTIGELKAAGLRTCIQLKMDALVANPDNYGDRWRKNAEWYLKLVAAKYGDSPLYYIPMNEPDNEGQRPSGVSALTTEQIVRVQKVVWETLKSINPGIKIASSPLCSFDNSEGRFTSSSLEVLKAGITEYCDYFAFHKHVDIGEDGRGTETDLWTSMDEAVKSGHPRRPAVLNENGTWLTLGLVFPEATEEEKHRFKAYWIGNDLIQMKALGLKYIVVYSLAGSLAENGEYNIMDVNTAEGSSYKINSLEYEAYRSLWNPAVHAFSKGIDGGFEHSLSSDKSRGWVVSFRGRSFEGIGRAEPKEWDYVSVTGGQARSGNHCLKMCPIDFVPTGVYDKKGISANRCRRLVEGLNPGRKYRLSAWVKLDKSDGSDPTATLRAMGFDSLGQSKAECSVSYSRTSSDYVLLKTEFTADNSWVVISLEHNGKGFAYWDDVSLIPEA